MGSNRIIHVYILAMVSNRITHFCMKSVAMFPLVDVRSLGMIIGCDVSISRINNTGLNEYIVVMLYDPNSNMVSFMLRSRQQ